LNKLELNDIISTVTQFTIETIVNSYQKFGNENIKEVIVSGGKNF
jgi:1,6-anhydro-N-acetylmuramate kinase